MFAFIAPHLHLESVLELSAERLRGLGLNALLLDMDCTLKDYRAERVGDEVREWMGSLQAERIALCIFSNGRAHRIGPLAEGLGVPFIAKAYKPLPFRCLRAVERLQFDRSRTAVVGDQLFADVLAGRLAGLFTILVRPTSPEEPWFTRLKRPAERAVLRRLKNGTQERMNASNVDWSNS